MNRDDGADVHLPLFPELVDDLKASRLGKCSQNLSDRGRCHRHAFFFLVGRQQALLRLGARLLRLRLRLHSHDGRSIDCFPTGRLARRVERRIGPSDRLVERLF